MKIKLKKPEEKKELSKIERALEVSRPNKYPLVLGAWRNTEDVGTCNCCGQDSRHSFVLQFLKVLTLVN